MIVPILIITLLIALNGLFVAAEFAIVGVSRAELANTRRERRSSVRLARWILGDPRRQDRFIATAQLGITAASLGLGMYGEHVVAGWILNALEQRGWFSLAAAHTVASILSITVLTYFHIVLGEMVPKSLALSHARRTVVWIAPIVRAVQLVFYPLVAALNGLGNGLLALFGVQRTRGMEHYRTPEDIAYIVRESEAGGLLRKESAQVVNELLDFGDLTAGEVMVPRVHVVGIPLGATTETLRAVLRSAPHTRYPVFEGTLDNIAGSIHVREFLRTMRGREDAISRETVRPVPFVPETARMDKVLGAMRELRSQLAIVMDEHGGTSGIITMEDLFEEVVGDITEKPGEVPHIIHNADGSVRADGAARLEDVGAELGVVLEHEEVATVSGLVLAMLSRPPHVGDVVVYDHVRFEVLAVRGHGVGSCRAARVAEEHEE